MKNIISRLSKLEAAAKSLKPAELLWVERLENGKYRVEEPDYRNNPSCTAPSQEDIYGRVVDEAFLEKFTLVLIHDAMTGVLSFRVN